MSTKQNFEEWLVQIDESGVIQNQENATILRKATKVELVRDDVFISEAQASVLNFGKLESNETALMYFLPGESTYFYSLDAVIDEIR